MPTAKLIFRCDECGATNAAKAQKINPVNLNVTHRRLCKPCQKKLGFAQVEYGHGSPSFISAGGERV